MIHYFERVLTTTKTAIRPSIIQVVVFVFLAIGVTATTQAVPITGTPQGNGFGWTPNSTNALNYAQLVPGREGQVVPYVLFNSNAIGSVTLDFFNFGPGLAFFEIRIDDIVTGVTGHPVVLGDTIHTGGNSVASGTSELGVTYSATNYVDVRLALGGERDWDFDWTRFEVLSAGTIPEPATVALFGLGLAGLGFSHRKKS